MASIARECFSMIFRKHTAKDFGMDQLCYLFTDMSGRLQSANTSSTCHTTVV